VSCKISLELTMELLDAIASYCAVGGVDSMLWIAYCNAYPFIFNELKVNCNQDQIRVTRFILMLLFDSNFIYLEVLKMITTRCLQNNYKLNRFSLFFGSASHHEALPLASAIIDKARFHGRTKLVLPYFEWLLQQGVDTNFKFSTRCCSTFCYAYIYAKDKKTCIFLESIFKNGNGNFKSCENKYHNLLPAFTLSDLKMLRKHSININQLDILHKLIELKEITKFRYNNISTKNLNSLIQYLKVWLFSMKDKPTTLYEKALYSTLENCSNIEQIDFLPVFIHKQLCAKDIEITKMCKRNGLV
jgi:hypothetical protein